MSEEDSLERELREVLSRTEPLTLQELEDEIVKMLVCLQPLPIKMRRVKGLVVEHAFLESDEFEDMVYRWDVGDLNCNGVSQLFVVALYEALEYRTGQMLRAREIALADLTMLEADRRAGVFPSEEEYRLAFDSIMAKYYPRSR